MSTEAIGATALGGEGDTIAVASPLLPDSLPTATTSPATTTMAATPAAPSAGAAAATTTLGSAATTAAAGVPSDRPIGLHSPPDSNNASKLDGGSSDSELSDLDDDVLADSLSIHPDDADAAATSVTTPTTAVAEPASSTAGDAPLDGSGEAEDDSDIGEIDPDHYSGTVPVFRPTMHQFRDFKKFMEKIDKYGMKSGIVKIIPPQEWKDSLGPLDEMVKNIKVREPIKQDIMGSNGTYRQVNILHQRTYNLPQWRQLCDQSEHQPPARRGERRANADKPKPAPRTRAAASNTPNTSAASGSASGSTPKGGKRGRAATRRKTRQATATADEDTASVVSEPRPMTPESQRGEDDKTVDDDKTCVDPTENIDSSKAPEDQDKIAVDDSTVFASVEVDHPIKKEEDDDMMSIGESCCTEPPAAPRRMGFTRQASAKTQSTSARRKNARREGSAKIDEAAFKDWDYRMDISDYTPERCEELERTYWKTLTYAQPLYGADLPGTLFSESTEMWNLNKLPNLLDVLGTKVPGVNTAYLYLGMWKATFAWHLEDVDLYSINYLHFGAPKQWYSISQGDARRFEAAMKSIWPTDAKACDQFLRHKAFLISPSHLRQHYNIRVNKCVSYPGEFVVTYPYGYHSGYNLGYNCAEAVNFALDSWLPMGKIAKKCECAEAQDSVWVDVYEIERKLRGISTDYEDDEEEDSDEDMDDLDEDAQDGSGIGMPRLPAGARSVRIRAPSRKRKRNDGSKAMKTEDPEESAESRKLKKMRMRLRSAEGAPCCLCPNDIPEAEILPTDDGRKAHRMCALYLPETYIEVLDGKDVVTNVANIPRERLELRCMYCRLRKGVCFQCSYTKCSRSYHATCAAPAGVFVEVGEVPVFGADGTEYKEQAFEFTCRFQRAKRDRKYDGDALEKNERIRNAAAALTTGAICQMQFYRSDIFAGVVVENRFDEEMLLLHVIPSGDQVEVEWKWLLLPDSADYRLPKASPNALPLPASRKEKEELNAKKRPVPITDDVFVDGYTWKEFHTCEAFNCYNKEQAKVELDKPNRLWHYIGRTSTDTKPHYTEDPLKPVHNPDSNFLESVPRPVAPLTMQPPRRPSFPPTIGSAPTQSFVPPPHLLQTSFQTPTQNVALTPSQATAAQIPTQPTSVLTPAPSPSQTASQPGQTSTEPRRSYSIIKPPYVPHTSPVTATSPAPPSSVSSGLKMEKPYIYKPRKPSDGFPTPQRPSSKHHHGSTHHHHSSSSHSSAFGRYFTMPSSDAGGSKFPQIQHPNLSHGYTAIPMGKPLPATTTGASPPSSSPPETGSSTDTGGEAKILPPPPPKAAGTGFHSPFPSAGASISGTDGKIRSHSKGKRSSSGATSLAEAARRLHKRGASSTSSNGSSFGFGLGLKGLTRPSSHTNYVGPPPPPSSTASSPYLSACNPAFGTRPGSVSSYASYDSMMGTRMSPHSPTPIDASPFIGSPGPPMGTFDFPQSMGAAASYQPHPGMRPQFSTSWQQNFNAPLGSYAQDLTDINFSPTSPIVSAAGLPHGGLGAPLNIVPGQHHHSFSFSGTTMTAGSPIAGTVGLGSMSPPMLPESPMPMSPSAPETVDAGTNQSPADQLKQQLRSISDSSLPSSYEPPPRA